VTATELQRRALRRHAALLQARRDPRYRRVIGRLVAAGVLTTTAKIEPNRKPVRVADALWAGRIEPRVLELLPALIVKRPALFVDPSELPADLVAAVRMLRKNVEPPEFRGVPGQKQLRWLPLVGRRKVPSRLKSFRLLAEDLALLRRLSAELADNETEVVRRGLRRLASALRTP
jgi:hypothetical protein